MRSVNSVTCDDLAIARASLARARDGDAAFDEAAVTQLIELRRDFLEALPIAAAIIAEDPAGDDLLQASNALFNRLTGADPAAASDDGAMLSIRSLPLLAHEGLASEVGGFIRSNASERQFVWRDGDAIGGRHFTVRFARLNALSDTVRRCLLTLVDRTAEIETARSLRSEMLHDSLTGLPNRVAFAEAIDTLVDATADEAASPAVIVIDLRRFSRINESLGGTAGDELIITVARRLISSLRPGDLLARIGGDEFAILLPSAKAEDALGVAERISAALASPFRLSDVEVRLEAAIGCTLGSEGLGAEDFVRQGQFAAKCAKTSRRVEFYRPAEARLAHRRFAIETELRRALDNGELALAFQPVVDLTRNRVAGFEALARWQHPDQGPIAPNEFIPIAEEAGLIVPLGRWALDQAAQTLAEWDRAAGRTLPLTMAVNVSACQIVNDDVAARLEEVLGRHRLDGKRFVLELTESVIINDPEQATRTLSALKALHAGIAMDDFGTGHSSLAYLQRLPIDILKIDRSFVTGMLGDRDAVSIVRAVLSLADALGMKATAEGVETFELTQTLSALGCRFAQGFHFAKPLPPQDALAYALSANA